MKNVQPMVLTLPEPINDGGRKYNWIYLVSGGVIGVWALTQMGFNGFVFGVLLGLCVGWLIKNEVLYFVCRDLRTIEFQVKNKIPYEQMIAGLIPVLTPLGMTIEKSSDKGGSPVILYQGIIYDVSYEDNKNTFTIWWRLNVARAFFNVDRIKKYRKIVIAMGIIGYHVQTLCSRTDMEETNGVTEESKTSAVNETGAGRKFCPECGMQISKDAKFCPGCGKNLG